MTPLSAAVEPPKNSDVGSIAGLLLRHPATRDTALFLTLAALAAAIYLPTLRHGFVEYDDPDYVAQNPKVLGGLSWDGMVWALTATHAFNWHPLTWLSLQLDAALFGAKPGGYHLTNLLLHAANAGVVYLLLRRLTGTVGRSWVAAALFAVHPLHVESVAWIAERKDVLSGLFGLLALLAYERYGRAPSASRMVLVTGLFLLGLLAKPMLVTLPFVMLLLDAWPLRRLRGPRDLARLCAEKSVLFVLVAASCAVTLSVQHRAMTSLAERTIPGRLLVAGVGYLKYLEKTVYPANLAVLYPLPDGPAPIGQAILGWVVVAAVTGVAFRLRRSAPYLLVGWLWFLGMLVPVIGVVQVGSQLHADRYTYLPQVGLCLALVWVAADLARRIQAPGWARVGMAVAVLAGYAPRASDQVVYWRSNTTLWEHAVAATEDNYIAYCNLGVQYVSEDRLGDALRCYTELCRASPYMFDARASHAHTLFDLGRLDEAGTSAAVAVKLAAKHPGQLPEPVRVSDCWYILGKASLGRGREAEALDCYREALRHHPLPVVHFALGTLLARLGRTAEAVAELEAARAASPTDPAVNFNLGVALSERGEWTRAAPVLADAVRGDPANTTFRNALAAALLATGQTAESQGSGRRTGPGRPAWAGTGGPGRVGHGHPSRQGPPPRGAGLLVGQGCLPGRRSPVRRDPRHPGCGVRGNRALRGNRGRRGGAKAGWRQRRDGRSWRGRSATASPCTGWDGLFMGAGEPWFLGEVMKRFAREILIGLSLAVVTLIAYANVWDNDFLDFDDHLYVVNNPHVLGGLTPAGFTYAWTTFDGGNWHPLTWLSLQLDGQVFGHRPAGYHVTNLLLHLANVLLLFAVLRAMTRAVCGSELVAALFAVHPLHVESVAWVAERKDVLSTFFLLLTLAAYVHYAARPGLNRYLLVFLSLTLGLLAKPMLVTVPVLLLLLDYWPLQRFEGSTPASPFPQGSSGRLLREKLPLLGLAAVFALITIWAQGTVRTVVALEALSPAQRLANACLGYAWYVGKTLWPTDLAVFYPHTYLALSGPAIAGAVLLLLALSALAVRLARRWPYLATGWFWFVLSLMPVIGLVQVGRQAFADRYTYIPHIGLFLLLVWGASDLLVSLRAGRPLLAGAAGAAILACVLLTRGQVLLWRDSFTLWQHTLRVTGDNWMAHDHLGKLYYYQGKQAEALVHFQELLRLEAGAADSHYLVGLALFKLKNYPGAEQYLTRALVLDRDHRKALLNLGLVRRRMGKQQGAVACFAAVLKLEPDNPLVHRELGMLFAQRGDMARAASHFLVVLQHEPDSAANHNNLALALIETGHLTRARAHLIDALRLDPDYADAHYNLGQLHEKQKEVPLARQHYAQAARLRPDDPEVREALRRLAGH